MRIQAHILTTVLNVLGWEIIITLYIATKFETEASVLDFCSWFFLCTMHELKDVFCQTSSPS